MTEYIKYGIILILLVLISIIIWKIFYNKEGYENIIIEDREQKEPKMIRPPQSQYPNANYTIVPEKQIKEPPKSILMSRPRKIKKLVPDDKKVTFSDFDIINKTKSPISSAFDYEVFNKYNAKYTDVSDLKF